MPNFTKEAIKRSFLRLLESKPYSDITVKDIVADCGINRNSFYYHYHDLPELTEEIAREQCEAMIQKYPAVSSLEECFAAVIDFAQTNQRALLHLFRSVDRSIFEQSLWKLCNYVVGAYFSSATAGHAVQPHDKAVLIRYYECTCFGLVMSYMDGGMRDDPVRDLHRLFELKEGQIEELIRRSEEHAGA